VQTDAGDEQVRVWATLTPWREVRRRAAPAQQMTIGQREPKRVMTTARIRAPKTPPRL
jgi:hypothetical protein